MTVAHFPPRLRMMSHLDRWGLMPTVFPDKVASHSWFVAVYSWMIADLLDWGNHQDRARLLLAALLHDVEEIVSGEMCWPAKQMLDWTKTAKFIGEGLRCQVPTISQLVNHAFVGSEAMTILKAADRLDACFVVAKESAFGNRAMAMRLPSCVTQLREYWFRLPGDESELQELWDRCVAPSIHAHSVGECYDFEAS